jgi:hypothetical protein
MKTALTIITLIVFLSFTGSCYYDKADLLYPDGKMPCDTSVVAKFSSDVLPVMNASCVSGCHSTAAASGGVILDTYAGVKIQAANGRLMGSMNQTGSCMLAKIQQWINSGTPNN